MKMQIHSQTVGGVENQKYPVYPGKQSAAQLSVYDTRLLRVSDSFSGIHCCSVVSL